MLESADDVISVPLRYEKARDHVTEFVVPTCSYRMGVAQIGYGAAVIGGSIAYIIEVCGYGAAVIGGSFAYIIEVCGYGAAVIGGSFAYVIEVWVWVWVGVWVRGGGYRWVICLRY